MVRDTHTAKLTSDGTQNLEGPGTSYMRLGMYSSNSQPFSWEFWQRLVVQCDGRLGECIPNALMRNPFRTLTILITLVHKKPVCKAHHPQRRQKLTPNLVQINGVERANPLMNQAWKADLQTTRITDRVGVGSCALALFTVLLLDEKNRLTQER